MSAPPQSSLALRVPPRFKNGREWHESLGLVPLDRVIWNPWPGTATETDLLWYVEVGGRLCELIHGTLLEKPVGAYESEIAGLLMQLLRNWNDANGNRFAFVGEAGTLRMASVDRVRLPDVGAISRDRLPGGRLSPKVKIPSVAPDLVVEVLSESNTPAEMRQKLTEYFDNGTRLAWYVDPATRTVAVHTSVGQPVATLGDGDALDGGDVMPGLSIDVSDLFGDEPEGE